MDPESLCLKIKRKPNGNNTPEKKGGRGRNEVLPLILKPRKKVKNLLSKRPKTSHDFSRGFFLISKTEGKGKKGKERKHYRKFGGGGEEKGRKSCKTTTT